MIILVDDEDRGNEGDLTMAAELAPRGYQFHGLPRAGAHLPGPTPDLVENSNSPHGADTTNQASDGILHLHRSPAGVTTGISAADRATTILTAVADNAQTEDLVSPGHVFPIRARKGGVLVRTGQTEGSVDLSRLAGLKGAAVICEIMKDDGTMARMPDLESSPTSII
jgi:3,4-dihydroxy 2-butanone 4-phosphate synthase/GTP cyclohydrolase II